MKHLLESVLDGSASPEQRRELIARMNDDVQLAGAYQRGTDLVSGLRALPVEEADVDLVSQARAQWQREGGAGAKAEEPSLPSSRESGSSRVSRSQAEAPMRAGTGSDSPAILRSSSGVLSGHARWLAVGAAVMLVLAVVFTRLITSPSAPPLGSLPGGWVAVDLNGAAWTETNGHVRSVALGDVLLPGARLTTGPEAEITLAFVEGTRLTLEPQSQVALLQDPQGPHAMLEGGVLSAEHRDGPPLHIRVRGSLQRLSVVQATARVLYSGDGRATVAATRGEIRVASEEGERSMHAGQQASLTPRGLMNVGDAAELHLSAQQGEGRWLVGETEPFVEVRVNGIAVVADEHGRFAVEIASTVRDVVVDVRDVWGRTLSRAVSWNAGARESRGGDDALEAPVKPSAPKLVPKPKQRREVETQWGWEPLREPG